MAKYMCVVLFLLMEGDVNFYACMVRKAYRAKNELLKCYYFSIQ